MLRYLVLMLVSAIFSCALASPSYLMTQKAQQKITPAQALLKLKQGNARFMADTARPIKMLKMAKYLASGQYPFAMVLSCMDSRSIPNILFDQGIGNLFVARVAGNVVDKNMLGSMEFATKFVGVKVLIVMGHTACGAIVGACKGVTAGNLTHLLSEIKPAVATLKADQGSEFSCTNATTIDDIARQNVLDQMQLILNNSEIINTLVSQHKLLLIGAMHDLATGKVTFFDIHNKNI